MVWRRDVHGACKSERKRANLIDVLLFVDATVREVRITATTSSTTIALSPTITTRQWPTGTPHVSTAIHSMVEHYTILGVHNGLIFLSLFEHSHLQGSNPLQHQLGADRVHLCTGKGTSIS